MSIRTWTISVILSFIRRDPAGMGLRRDPRDVAPGERRRPAFWRKPEDAPGACAAGPQSAEAPVLVPSVTPRAAGPENRLWCAQSGTSADVAAALRG